MQTAVHALHSPDLLSEGRGLARFRTGVMVLAMVVLGVFLKASMVHVTHLCSLIQSRTRREVLVKNSSFLAFCRALPYFTACSRIWPHETG